MFSIPRTCSVYLVRVQYTSYVFSIPRTCSVYLVFSIPRTCSVYLVRVQYTSYVFSIPRTCSVYLVRVQYTFLVFPKDLDSCGVPSIFLMLNVDINIYLSFRPVLAYALMSFHRGTREDKLVTEWQVYLNT